MRRYTYFVYQLGQDILLRMVMNPALVFQSGRGNLEIRKEGI